ncbi:hypothetical protein GJ496_001766 [Pomphorhynchus laevis]|nr:hypothetical protein GJ496_001766 [Pomphorhynchus laevis]
MGCCMRKQSKFGKENMVIVHQPACGNAMGSIQSRRSTFTIKSASTSESTQYDDGSFTLYLFGSEPDPDYKAMGMKKRNKYADSIVSCPDEYISPYEENKEKSKVYTYYQPSKPLRTWRTVTVWADSDDRIDKKENKENETEKIKDGMNDIKGDVQENQ